LNNPIVVSANALSWRREENRGGLQNLVGLLEISHFTLKILDALVLASRGSRPRRHAHLDVG
jgi:hypothetical protein